MAAGPTEMAWGCCEYLPSMPEWEAIGLRGQNKSEGERHRQVRAQDTGQLMAGKERTGEGQQCQDTKPTKRTHHIFTYIRL